MTDKSTIRALPLFFGDFGVHHCPSGYLLWHSPNIEDLTSLDTLREFHNNVKKYANYQSSEHFDWFLCFEVIEKAQLNSSDIPRIESAVKIYAGMALVKRMRRLMVIKLCWLLIHRYPKVRATSCLLTVEIWTNCSLDSQCCG